MKDAACRQEFEGGKEERRKEGKTERGKDGKRERGKEERGKVEKRNDPRNRGCIPSPVLAGSLGGVCGSFSVLFLSALSRRSLRFKL
jgi:hypothetical protein